MTTFPFISKEEIARAREHIEQETGMSKRTWEPADSIFDPLMESTGQRFKTVEALFAHLDTDEDALFAATGRAILTAEDLEAATYILRSIWQIRAEHGDAAALETAEDWASEPGDWLEDEESEPETPTPEAIEAGRELMDRLVPVAHPGVVSLGCTDEDLDDILGAPDQQGGTDA